MAPRVMVVFQGTRGPLPPLQSRTRKCQLVHKCCVAEGRLAKFKQKLAPFLNVIWELET